MPQPRDQRATATKLREGCQAPADEPAIVGRLAGPGVAPLSPPAPAGMPR